MYICQNYVLMWYNMFCVNKYKNKKHGTYLKVSLNGILKKPKQTQMGFVDKVYIVAHNIKWNLCASMKVLGFVVY